MVKVVPIRPKEDKTETVVKYNIRFPEDADLKIVIKFLNLLNLYVTDTPMLTQEYRDFISQHPECCVRIEETVKVEPTPPQTSTLIN
jgi:hypothetical protein